MKKIKKETKKSKILKESKGITLIALVITIIVLLILAAVSIATLTGDNGILTKAQEANKQNTQSGEKEQIKLAYDAVMAENYEKGNYGAGVTASQLQTELQKYDSKITVGEDGENLKVTFPSGNVYTVKKDGRIEGPTEEKPPVPLNPGDTASSTVKDNYTDSNNDKATIPEGFKVSTTDGEKNVNDGLVVIGPDGSEFVWVPVETTVAESEAAGTGNKAMAIDLNKDNTDGTGEPKYRGLLYDFTSGSPASTSSVKENCTTTTDSYREPAYLSSYDSTYGITEEILQKEYNDMISSVVEYGGFYIGRYEMSLTGATSEIVGTGTAQSVGGVKPSCVQDSDTKMWYGLYGKAKTYSTGTLKTGSINNDSVVSSMIWGSQWDAMLNWIQKNNIDVTSSRPGGAIRNDTCKCQEFL